MGSWDMVWQQQHIAIWLIVIALAAVLVIVFFWRGKGGSDVTRESPEEILKRRYANGEIDDATYTRMREQLRESGPT